MLLSSAARYHPVASQLVSLVLQEMMVCLKLCCARGHCNVSVTAHRLGKAQVPHSYQEGGPGTLPCPCLCTADVKGKGNHL